MGPGGSAVFNLPGRDISVSVAKIVVGKPIPSAVLVSGLSSGVPLKILLGESAKADGYLIRVSKYNTEDRTVMISIEKV